MGRLEKLFLSRALRAGVLLALTGAAPGAFADDRAVVRVHPGDDIQASVDRAAAMSPRPIVRFAPGLYAPRARGQALLHLNRMHDGLTLEAEGNVTLTAANEALASRAEPSYPAVVNHVLYIGEGVSGRTVVRGFRITGAHGFLTHDGENVAEPTQNQKRFIVFYSDGGGIKVFGNSAPVLEDLVVEDNLAFFCGGGLSVEQGGRSEDPVVIRRSRFYRNRAPLTGGAIDVLPGSRVRIESSELAGNEANDNWLPHPELRLRLARFFGLDASPAEWERAVDFSRFADSSAVTVFEGSSLEVTGSRFTGNSAAIDLTGYTDWYWKGAMPVVGGFVRVRDSVFFDNGRFDLAAPGREACRLSLEATGFLPRRPGFRAEPATPAVSCPQPPPWGFSGTPRSGRSRARGRDTRAEPR